MSEETYLTHISNTVIVINGVQLDIGQTIFLHMAVELMKPEKYLVVDAQMHEVFITRRNEILALFEKTKRQ